MACRGLKEWRGCKTTWYRQWKLRHVTLFKWVETIASIRTSREDKETTKIRAVFDASCASDAASLNDCVYSGPNLLSKIFDILPRFRFNFIAILADSKQAFLNVEILKEHRDFRLFLWYENVNLESDAKLIVHRFLRVVFGVTSSPFLLNGTIRHPLSKNLSCDEKFVERLLEDR